MNKIIAMDGNLRYERISKAKARKLYEEGKAIVLCPVKLFPFGGFRPSVMVQDDGEPLEVDSKFEYTVRNFEWYNCQWNETGKYTAFYYCKDQSK